MKIFIAGCARSGTSLTRGLMQCFRDLSAPGGFLEGREKPASEFEAFEGEAKHIVLKRTATCYETLGDLRRDAELLYCVRQPFDTLTSSHRQSVRLRRFHVTPERWTGEYEGWRSLRSRQPGRRVFVLRYEDLVRDPDGTQDRISRHFGLTRVYRFSRNPDGVKIGADSVEKWRRDPDLIPYFDAFEGDFLRQLKAFCDEFDYVLPEPYARRAAAGNAEAAQAPVESDHHARDAFRR